MKRLAFLVASIALAFLLGSCGSKGSSAEPPANFQAVAGDASVTLTWTAEPDVDYWIFFAPAPGVSTTNWSTLGGTVLAKSQSPRTITGLTNGRTYSFTINGRKESGPGGPGAPTIEATPQLAGATWVVNPPLGSAKLNAATVGQVAAGLALVAVADGGGIYSGINLDAPVARTSPVATDLKGITYGTPGFIAFGANGALLQSIDAIAWNTLTSPTTATLRTGTSALTGNFVVAGDGGAMATSTDGATWVAGTSGTTNTLYGSTFGGGRFILVGANGTIITGTDGTTWTTVAPVTTQTLRAVTFAILSVVDSTGATVNANLFVAVGDNGALVTSPDGLEWKVQPAFTAANLNGLVFGGQFVAVGPSGAAYTSPDAINWTVRTTGTANNLNAVVRQVTGYSAFGDLGTFISTR